MKNISRIHVLLLALIMAWSLNNIAMKVALRSMDPLTFLAIRGAIGNASLVGLFLMMNEVWSVRRADIGRLILLGLSGITLNQLLFTFGMFRTTAASASLLISVGPVFGLAFGILIAKERGSAAQWVGVVAALIGAALIVAGSGGQVDFGVDSLVGDLLIMGGVASWSLFAVLGRPMLKLYSPAQIATFSWLIGYACMLPLAAGPALGTWQNIDLLGWAMVAYAGIILSLTQVLWNRSVAKIGASESLIFMNLLPVFGAIFAVLLLNDTITLMQMAGAAVVLASVYVAQQK